MFRFATRFARYGALRSVRMMSSEAASSSTPKGLVIGAVATSALAAAWIWSDGGLNGTKIHSGNSAVASTASKKAKAAPISFNNLAVNTLPNGQFKIEYDNDDTTVHYTLCLLEVLDKSGKTVSESEAAIVKPVPPPAPLPSDVVAKIAGLEAALQDASSKIDSLENEAKIRKAVEEEAAAEVAKALAPTGHKLKLSYFPIRGRAEAVRLLLIDNGISFEDDRLGDAEFGALKPTLHFGQVPALYDNGVQVPQSNSILRHLGRVYNLYGNSLDEATRLDFVNDGVEDVRSAYLKVIYYAWDSKPTFLENLPKILTPLENLVTGTYIVGDKPQYADYSLYETLDTLVVMSPSALDSTPNLKAFHQRMAARPKIAAYVASSARPSQINGNKNQ